jgi:hypothetical protein
MTRMFFVIKNNIDKSGSHVSAEIVSHASSAEKILENTVTEFVAYEGGREMAENIKIIDIHELTQVAEPLIDTILLYRVTSIPNQIHVYRRGSREVPGYVFGPTIVSEFTRIKIFELVKYTTEVKIQQSPVIQETVDETIHDIPFVKETKLQPAKEEIQQVISSVEETIEIITKSIQVEILPTIVEEPQVISPIEETIEIIKPIQVEILPTIVAEQIETVCKNSEILKLRPMNLLQSLESSAKFLRMKEKND